MAREQTGETLIAAPKTKVWAVLANLETVQDYDPFVRRAYFLTEARVGVGAARHCDVIDGTFVRERVTEWREGDGYSITVDEDNQADFPLTDQALEFHLGERDGGTTVEARFSYGLKPDAKVSADEADAMAGELVSGVLEGLRAFVETGEPTRMPEGVPA